MVGGSGSVRAEIVGVLVGQRVNMTRWHRVHPPFPPVYNNGAITASQPPPQQQTQHDMCAALLSRTVHSSSPPPTCCRLGFVYRWATTTTTQHRHWSPDYFTCLPFLTSNLIARTLRITVLYYQTLANRLIVHEYHRYLVLYLIYGSVHVANNQWLVITVLRFVT